MLQSGKMVQHVETAYGGLHRGFRWCTTSSNHVVHA